MPSLADEGANITLLDSNCARGTAVAVSGNVVNRADVDTVVKRRVESFGRLDCIFAIAGTIKSTHFLETTEENFPSTLDVNALGTLIRQKEAAKQLIKQGIGGKLIVTSSITGRQGYPNFASYCESKFAVTALNQSAAHALANHKNTSNAFAPVVVDTSLWKKLDLGLMDMGDSSRPWAAFESLSGANLIGRKGVPEERDWHGALPGVLELRLHDNPNQRVKKSPGRQVPAAQGTREGTAILSVDRASVRKKPLWSGEPTLLPNRAGARLR